MHEIPKLGQKQGWTPEYIEAVLDVVTKHGYMENNDPGKALKPKYPYIYIGYGETKGEFYIYSSDMIDLQKYVKFDTY